MFPTSDPKKRKTAKKKAKDTGPDTEKKKGQHFPLQEKGKTNRQSVAVRLPYLNHPHPFPKLYLTAFDRKWGGGVRPVQRATGARGPLVLTQAQNNNDDGNPKRGATNHVLSFCPGQLVH